jgi:hypothetical protein
MPQYAEPWKHRIMKSTLDAIRDYPDFPEGSRRWDERVYHPDMNGVDRPSASFGLTARRRLTCAWSSSSSGCWAATRSATVCALPGMNRTNCNSRWASRKRSKAVDSSRFGPARIHFAYALGTPRVAYFPDTFYEINGVAHTSRHFEAFAQRRGLPFFVSIRAKETARSASNSRAS